MLENENYLNIEDFIGMKTNILILKEVQYYIIFRTDIITVQEKGNNCVRHILVHFIGISTSSLV